MDKSISYGQREKGRETGVSYRGLNGRQTIETRDTGVDDLHWGNLFDENEDVAGQRLDDSTGREIDNSTYTDEVGVLRSGGYVVTLAANGEEPVLEPWEEEDQTAEELADAWLAAHENEMSLGDLPGDRVA